ncbi:MAG TPA: sigma-70 family RNA polymerase sigma factor [Blastocatellia bacterium]|nr:sigma-70 family RNA polymerase sigma factor [Blastocatellia bacterium]
MHDSTEASINRLVDHLFRHQAGQMISSLTRVFGPQRLDLAEEVVQDALVKALKLWPFRGVPDNPAAWLIQVAKNRALDLLRRETSLRSKADAILEVFTAQEEAAREADARSGRLLLDDELSMMFMACHKAIPREGRVALTLKTVSGFGVGEIARAFLAREATIAQRIVRAKRQIREEGIRFEMPGSADLTDRLDSVLEVLYLLFNEGYTAHRGENLVRGDLCEEAIRLCRLVAHHPVTDLPESHALLSLMLLQAARLPARIGDEGDLFILSEQDRTLWDRRLIHEGLMHLELCAQGNLLTEYHLQAGIAACHAVAESYEATDWKRIVVLYDQLQTINPTPVVALNRAVALSRWLGPEAGIKALEEIGSHPSMAHYYLLPATLGELWSEVGESDRASAFYRTALSCSCSEPERRFLIKKLEAVEVFQNEGRT